MFPSSSSPSPHSMTSPDPIRTRLHAPQCPQRPPCPSNHFSHTVLAFITSAVHHPYHPHIPTYYHFTSCASALALFLYLPTLHDQTPKSFKDLNDDVLHFPSMPLILASQMPQPLLDRDDFAYNYFLDFATWLPKAKGIITNTFEVLKPRAIKAISDGACVPNHETSPIYCIGPLINENSIRSDGSDWNSLTKCLMWLDEQPRQSVVFLCFGSRGAFSAAQVKEIAIGLEKSNQRFLWVVRSSSPQDLELEELLPKGFLERTRGRGLVVKPWAPQVSILRHESVGGFVTHWGGTR